MMMTPLSLRHRKPYFHPSIDAPDAPHRKPRLRPDRLTLPRTSAFLPRYPQVVIYRPARAACQQGKALLNTWKIHPGEQQKWENPLMGWTSTGDASAHQFNSTMYFDSKEAAMAFCDKHGWEFEVQEPQLMGKGASTIPGAGKAGVRPKSYGDNFSSARKGTPIWPHPGFGAEAKN